MLVKAISSDGVPETKESPLVVCFGEMLIDFVPTTNGLSLAEAPAFKKAPGGAPANVAVGIARLGGNAAFIGKVLYGKSVYISLHAGVTALYLTLYRTWSGWCRRIWIHACQYIKGERC